MGYIKKLAVCLLTGVVAAVTLQRIIYRIIWEFGDQRVPPPVYGITGCVIVVLAAVIYSVRWHRKEKEHAVDPQQVMAVWQGILAGAIGLDLAMFGWQKLFHQQGAIPLARLDEPFSSFSGEALSWAYFGHSFAFFCLIGVFQIAGALMLVIRRTRLFGAIFLLPVVLNIVLLNIFYGFDWGDLVHSLILLTGLTYMILQHYQPLVALFFPRDGGLRGFPKPKHVMLAGVVMVAPLLLVISFGSPDRNPQLTGKYRVQGLTVNRVRSAAKSCQDSVLTTVYFDLGNEMVLEFNGMQRIWIGRYRLDRSTGALVASWHYPMWAKDTLYARLDRRQLGEWRLMGSMGKDTLEARLVKE
jgi:hypothetical protein